jgi:superfamily II DNA or RNA helicase
MECLLTCKRISEGVDRQSITNVVLFSSSRSELETIQRIGRALRIDRRNPDKRAVVVDFVVRSDLAYQKQGSEGEPADKERFEWLTRVSKTRRRV